jgi:hypothetical protein
MHPASVRPVPTPASPAARGIGGFVGIALAVLAIIAAGYSVVRAAGAPLVLFTGGLALVLGLVTAGLWLMDLTQPSGAQLGNAAAYAGSDGEDGMWGGGGTSSGVPWARPVPPARPSTLYSEEELQKAAQRTSAASADEGNALGDDPLYALDPVPDGIGCFILPKEGETLARCQDCYALDVARFRYAVTDGVSNSFVPRPWARLMARGFVDHSASVLRPEQFATWLQQAAQAWRRWMWDRWVPATNARRERLGERVDDWTEQIERKGAEATLIGCAFRHNKQSGVVEVGVWSVGDAECFVAQPQDGSWKVVQAFPNTSAEQFDSFPLTLSTLDQPERVARTWDGLRTTVFALAPGDCVVLTSDTLAKWVLGQADERMTQLLALRTPEEFAALVQAGRDSVQMEDDDMTALIIPAPSPSRKLRGQERPGARR